MYFALLWYCAGLSKIECVPFLQTFAWPCQNDLPHFTCTMIFCAVRMLPWLPFFVLPFLFILHLSPSFQDPLTQRWTELTWVLPFENQLLQEVDVAAQELLWQSFEQHFPDGNIGAAETHEAASRSVQDWLLQPVLAWNGLISKALNLSDKDESMLLSCCLKSLHDMIHDLYWFSPPALMIFDHGSKPLYSLKRQMPLDYKRLR